MRIPPWRLALIGVAVVVLAVVGIGLVTATTAPATPTSNVLAADPTTDPTSTDRPDRRDAHERLGDRRAAWGPRLLRLGRHLVHVEATVTDRDGQLIVVWLDHGTVQSVSGDKITITEAGSTTQTVQTGAETIVRVGREDGTLADVTAGDEVFVQSRVVDGSPLAKRIVIIPARPG